MAGFDITHLQQDLLKHVPWPNRGWQQRFFNQQKWAPKRALISFAQTPNDMVCYVHTLYYG